MAQTQIWTFNDLTEHVLDSHEIERTEGANLRSAVRAVLEAYRAITAAYDWTLYRNRYILPTVANQSSSTITYDHCVTPEHQALTPLGWKGHRELKVGDTILAYDHSTNTTRWERLQKIHIFAYSGKLLEVGRRGRNILRCTPNHKFPVFDRVGGGKNGKQRKLASGGFITADKITSEQSVPLGAPCEFSGKSALSPRDAAILGWAITDGTGLLDKEKCYGASIIQSVTANAANCKKIEALVQTKRRGPYASTNNCARWSIPAETARRIKAVIAKTEDLPWLVTQLSPEAAQAMFDSMLAAEGSCTAAGRLCFTQWHEKRKPIAEAFQILAIVLGRAANFCERKYRQGTRYQVTVRTSKHFKPARLSKWSDYSGIIWCPQVRTGAWVCRCNGAVTITGNSGGTYERELTIAAGTWPSWAAFGKIIIDSVHYDVEDRKSSTVLTLTAQSNPGADVAALTTYNIYREAYPLPVNFRALSKIIDTGNQREVQIVSSEQQQFSTQTCYQTPGTPWQATIRGDNEYFGSMGIVFSPPPDAIGHYDILYHRSPRDLNIEKYATGTVTTSGTTVTLVGGTFSEDCVGSIIRFSESATVPSSVVGFAGGASPVSNRYYAQRTVVSRTSSTVVEIDSGLTTNVAAKAFLLSDPLDIEYHAMFGALKARAEAEFHRFRDRKGWETKMAYADKMFRLAVEADNRAPYASSFSAYDPFSRATVQTDDA